MVPLLGSVAPLGAKTFFYFLMTPAQDPNSEKYLNESQDLVDRIRYQESDGHILVTKSGHHILAIRSWLPDLGYQILATRSWMADPGCQVLNSRSCMPDAGWPDPGCQILPKFGHRKECFSIDMIICSMILR